VRTSVVHGANGTDGADRGDTIGYSVSAGHVDTDARADLIANEMMGNGLAPDTIDVGNLIVVSGAQLLPEPSTELLALAALLTLGLARCVERPHGGAVRTGGGVS
jgi:hypothetical protein